MQKDKLSRWKEKYGKHAHLEILGIMDKPYYYIVIAKKFKVSERTAKRWICFLR